MPLPELKWKCLRCGRKHTGLSGCLHCPPVPDPENELRAALGQLLEQVYQMEKLFDDSDGAIARAIDDAEKALRL